MVCVFQGVIQKMALWKSIMLLLLLILLVYLSYCLFLCCEQQFFLVMFGWFHRHILSNWKVLNFLCLSVSFFLFFFFYRWWLWWKICKCLGDRSNPSLHWHRCKVVCYSYSFWFLLWKTLKENRRGCFNFNLPGISIHSPSSP